MRRTTIGRHVLALYAITAIFGLTSVLFSGTRAQAADVPAPNVSVPRQTYVIGRDKEIPISGRLPAECAGTSVKAALYTRGPAAAVNPMDDVVAPSAIVVAADGSLSGALVLPSQIRPSLASDALGLSGDCLARPVFYLEGPIYLAIADKGPGGSFVIPASVLSSRTNIAGGLTIAEDIQTLTATVDSTRCATVDLVKGAALDAEGNARIQVGAAGQPAICSREGATVTFVNGKEQALVETRTLMPGVAQPLANVAPQPASTGGAPAPGVPSVGSGLAADSSRTWPAALFAAMLLVPFGALTWMVRRRRG